MDNTLRSILKEVHSVEEFEQEKAIFQVNIFNYTIFFYERNVVDICFIAFMPSWDSFKQ